MAPKGYLSPDTEAFFSSFGALFTEANDKGYKKPHELRDLRTSIANYLVKCGTTTAARAGSTNPVVLPNGDRPDVVLAKPPSWLKIDDNQRQNLVRTTKTNKFFDILRKYVIRQAPQIPNAKRRKGIHAHQPAPKKLKSNVAPQTLKPTLATKKIVRIKVNPTAINKQTVSEDENDDSDEHGSETSHEPVSSPNPDHIERSEFSPTLGMHGEIKADEMTPQIKVEEDDSQQLASIDGQDHSLHNKRIPSCADKSPKSTNKVSRSQEAIKDPENNCPTTPTLPVCIQAEADSGDEADENDRVSQLNGLFGAKEEESSSEQRQPVAPQTGEEIVSMVRDLSSEIESVECASWEDYKPRLIQHLRHLGMEHFVPCEPLEPALAGNPTKGLNTMLNSYGEELAKIPSQDWEQVYQPELAKLCASEEIRHMNFQQRLSKIGKIVYLKEEEAVLATRDWDRLKLAVRLCVLVSQATGPETEDTQDLANTYTTSRLRDIMWLEKNLKARDTIRKVAEQASGVGQSA